MLVVYFAHLFRLVDSRIWGSVGLHTDSYLAAGLRVYAAHCCTRTCSSQKGYCPVVHALAITVLAAGRRVRFSCCVHVSSYFPCPVDGIVCRCTRTPIYWNWLGSPAGTRTCFLCTCGTRYSGFAVFR